MVSRPLPKAINDFLVIPSTPLYLKNFFSYLYECLLCMHISTPMSCDACGDGKKLLDSLDL